jgi:hypothetical protein
VQIEDFRILLALEPSWTISINRREFLHVRSTEIEVEGSVLRLGRFSRTIVDIACLALTTIRVRARSRFRSVMDVFVFYSGEKLPTGAELRRRRTVFQKALVPAISKHFGRRVTHRTLHSDKRRGIGGAYPRFLVGSDDAVLAVDPDETSPVINGLMRAAIQWAPAVRRRISVVVPADRSQTLITRLKAMPGLQRSFDWLEWDGEGLAPLCLDRSEVESTIHPYVELEVGGEVRRILAMAPRLLQAVPQISGRAVSIRLRGLELARVAEKNTQYPLGEPLEPLIERLAEERRYGSRHPLARAHEEAWLESNLIGQMRDLLPVRQDCIYPQVPSFEHDERKIIDLLTVTDEGRLVVIEIKAAPDPDLPFQAFDYWLAVERHRKAGDFETSGYFRGIRIRDEPALLVMVAPLLMFHKSMGRLLLTLPKTVPLLQLGINQRWKKEIKVLRRQGALG